MNKFLIVLTNLIVLIIISTSLLVSSCAQIGMPTGGPKDSLPPKLIKATPPNGSVNVRTNKIVLNFNEYIELQNLQENLLVSPTQNKNPTITSTPNSIIIKFKDTLTPNTTYTINFGNTVKDINEGNVYTNLTYLFATGNTIDSQTVIGKVILAETGTVDSSLNVLLYINANDSSVNKKKPNYIAKVDGEGNFEFSNLPKAAFTIYALKDGDGSRTYNSPSELFAFAEVAPIITDEITLYAYATNKETNKTVKIKDKIKIEKKLRYSTSLSSSLDILKPITVNFNNPLKKYDSSHIYITDTFYNKIKGVKLSLDSAKKQISIQANWLPDMPLVLLIDTLAIVDTVGNKLSKNDTTRFYTMRKQDYGRVNIRFNGLNLTNQPVLIFLIGDDIKYSFPLLSNEWVNDLILPADYTVRILYDTDKDGKWTTGDYAKKLQPEKNITLPQKLAVKADWDNDRDINL